MRWAGWWTWHDLPRHHPDETKKGGWWVPVVKDAVVATANAANPVARDLAPRGHDPEAVPDLWIGGKKLTWGDLVAKPAVRVPVRVYTRADACGAADVWALYLGNKKQEDLKGLGVNNDPGVAEAVKRDKSGIGYNNCGLCLRSEDRPAREGAPGHPHRHERERQGSRTSESFYATCCARQGHRRRTLPFAPGAAS